MKRSLYTLAILSLFSGAAKAQYNLGVATSNWSGLNSLYLNPANIADSRHRLAIDIVGINAGVDNNLGTLNTNGGIFDLVNDGNSNNIFKYGNNNTFSLLAPYVHFRLPGVMVSINSRHSVALTAGIRGMNQFNNFDRSLYRTLTETDYAPEGNVDLTSRMFNYTAHVWSEIAGSYGAVVVDEFQHKLKVGVTLRYLGGIGYIGLRGNNLDAHYKGGDNDTLFVTKSDLEFASNAISTRSAVVNGISNHNIFDDFFGSKDGHGFGGDIGVVYEFNPNPTEHADYHNAKKGRRNNARNNYLLRASAAIVDIGSIKYSRDNNSNARVSGDGVVVGNDFESKVSNYETFREYAVSHGFTADTFHRDTRVYMPTRLNMAVDVRVYKRIYVNAMFVANLANRQNFGNSYYNQLTVTPRYDSKLFSVGMPITYGILSNTVKMGVGIRFSGFYIGSDDMLALVAGNQSGANVYVGGFIPFNKRAPKEHYHRDDEDTSGVEIEPDYDHGGSNDEDDADRSRSNRRGGGNPEEKSSPRDRDDLNNSVTGRKEEMNREIEKKD